MVYGLDTRTTILATSGLIKFFVGRKEDDTRLVDGHETGEHSRQSSRQPEIEQVISSLKHRNTCLSSRQCFRPTERERERERERL